MKLGYGHKWKTIREGNDAKGSKLEQCQRCELKRVHYPDINEWLIYE